MYFILFIYFLIYLLTYFIYLIIVYFSFKDVSGLVSRMLLQYISIWPGLARPGQAWPPPRPPSPFEWITRKTTGLLGRLGKIESTPDRITVANAADWRDYVTIYVRCHVTD